MNIDEVIALTDEELNYTIGQFNGYEETDPKDMPLWHKDLNLTHLLETEILNKGDLWTDYQDFLMELITRKAGYQAAELLFHASARTRAEAYLLTKSVEKS